MPTMRDQGWKDDPMSTPRVTYRKVPVTLPEDRVDALYEVCLDGTVMGRVARRRETIRARYRGSRIGYDRTGTHWRYQTADGPHWRSGPTWSDTRDQATLGLLRDEHGMTFEEIREALDKPRTWA